MQPPLVPPTPWISTSGRYRFAATLRAGLAFGVIGAIASAVAAFAPLLFAGVELYYVAAAPWIAAGAFAVAAYMAFSSYLSAASIRYQLLDEELQFRSGVISRSVTALPYARIQTVSMSNGVVDRVLGLSHLVCQSAADESNITIPGLSDQVAESTRAFILERSRMLRAAPH